MSGGLEWAISQQQKELSKNLIKEFSKLDVEDQERLMNYYKYRKEINKLKNKLKAYESKLGEVLYG